jgi:hypothetical protein
MNIELNNRELTTPGLYVMRWKGRTGLVRVVGQQRTGFNLINPENTPETYMADLPKDGLIPPDAVFSEPLNITVAP